VVSSVFATGPEISADHCTSVPPPMRMRLAALPLSFVFFVSFELVTGIKRWRSQESVPAANAFLSHAICNCSSGDHGSNACPPRLPHSYVQSKAFLMQSLLACARTIDAGVCLLIGHLSRIFHPHKLNHKPRRSGTFLEHRGAR